MADAGASGAAGADGARAQLIPEKLGGVGAAGFGRGGGPLPREGKTQRRRFNCTEMAVIYEYMFPLEIKFKTCPLQMHTKPNTIRNLTLEASAANPRRHWL